MKLLNVVFLLVGIWFSLPLVGQDTIYFLNGDIRLGKIIHSDSITFSYSYIQKKKVKERTISQDLVFSIHFESGKRKIIYTDSTTEYTETVEEMQLRLWGMHDANEHYRATWITVGGVVSQAVVGYFLYDSFFAGVGPLAYTLGVSLSATRPPQQQYRTEEIQANPHYQNGYMEVAKSKKIYGALAGSIIGLTVGILAGNAAN
jgi:hypothetical protein